MAANMLAAARMKNFISRSPGIFAYNAWSEIS
jgi:hypothetical protein